MPQIDEHGKLWDTDWRVIKFDDPENKISEQIKTGHMTVDEAIATYADKFIGEEHIYGNLALTEGIKYIIWAIAGTMTNVDAPASENQFTNALAYLGVGTGTGAAAQADSALTSGVWVAIDDNYPVCSAATPWIVTWQATFAAGVASQSWQEFSLGNTSAGAVMLNRKVEDKGTKAAGESWVLQLQITIS
jgi:hypothetical protein